MLPNSRATPPERQQEQQPKRRRVTQACISCRTRKSRFDYRRHFQEIEDRLNQLESLFDEGSVNVQSSSMKPWNTGNTTEHNDRNSNTPNLISTSDDPLTGSMGSDDPTDGMGHFVFSDEEDRAYFGPSSNIAFTSDLSRALKRVSRTRGRLSPGNQQTTTLPEFHIARVSRPNSPVPRAAPWVAEDHQEDNVSTSSVFYLPPDQETSALIDQYFANTGLLFPYLHEETFRETYAKLKHSNATTRRTWLGVLNMVLALATHTTVLQIGQVDKRQTQSERFYRRANGLCAEYVMNGASLEIVQYLLLVSQYMQGTKSSIQTWATHGLAVKVALQLGLHSAEASKRFPSIEREIRKRTWFGCIVLDRTLSMTFGRPASIPENYSRLELPIYFDLIEPRERVIEARHRCRYSTDFFNATIRLYSILGNAIDLLYEGNLGSEDKILNYELITRVLRMRHLLEEWTEQLPKHLGLIRAQNCTSQLGKDPTIDRFRTILTLRYHNIRLLIHRVVLVRLCDSLDDLNARGQDVLALQDVAWSTMQIATDSGKSNSNQVIIQNTTMFTQSNDYHQDNSVPDEQIADQNLSFLDFDFMANELFDVTDDFLQGRNF
ncbi:uncharacterized protein TRUGW13939_05313 [Talaromyces rugulosus]|uniref:Xylanolytic transcriptional activator regulatory domain-containing protein n=1 Tax=Talaromyces rugulosus TaxID=121627 RepID=A0A7H8QVV0_TALRU|nr:uncharacterized protein TRUGW13939_05313 [Talaromyces rugulosus]QKX58192.1 hypothetical protein TRUGW13939_05313 [Talaromyces rugulosus]